MAELIIKKDLLQKNIEIIRSMTSSKIIAVVKGNGYGLGLIEAANFYLDNGVTLFAVADTDEALILSQNGFMGNVLLMTPPHDLTEAISLVENNVICSVSSLYNGDILNAAAKTLGTQARVHIKIDTGFGRFGFTDGKQCIPLKDFGSLIYEGCFSHFSSAFSSSDEYTEKQYEKFITAKDVLKKNGIIPSVFHICNSPAFLNYPHMHLDAVRIGSAFLGRIPITNTFGLSKIGHLETVISQVKDLPAGHPIGYANTFITKKPTTTAVINAGYIHGINMEKGPDTFRLTDSLRNVYRSVKSYRKKLFVNIDGKPAPVLGRISMYHITADVTDMGVSPGDPVKIDVNPLFVSPFVRRTYCD